MLDVVVMIMKFMEWWESFLITAVMEPDNEEYDNTGGKEG